MRWEWVKKSAREAETSNAALLAGGMMTRGPHLGAGAFTGPTFKYKSIDDSEEKDEKVFSSKRWRYIYHDQEQDLISKKYEQISFKTQKKSSIKRHKKEQERMDKEKTKLLAAEEANEKFKKEMEE